MRRPSRLLENAVILELVYEVLEVFLPSQRLCPLCPSVSELYDLTSRGFVVVFGSVVFDFTESLVSRRAVRPSCLHENAVSFVLVYEVLEVFLPSQRLCPLCPSVSELYDLTSHGFVVVFGSVVVFDCPERLVSRRAVRPSCLHENAVSFVLVYEVLEVFLPPHRVRQGVIDSKRESPSPPSVRA